MSNYYPPLTSNMSSWNNNDTPLNNKSLKIPNPSSQTQSQRPQVQSHAQPPGQPDDDTIRRFFTQMKWINF